MSADSAVINVLMVCTGNICRSPLAEGIFRHLTETAGLAHAIHVDSAGTGNYHVGDPPDPRAQQIAQQHGLDISAQHARQLQADDFNQFHYIIALDQRHLTHLQQHQPATSNSELCLLAPFATRYSETEVADPYYGDLNAFEDAFSLIEDALHGFLSYIQSQHQNRH